MIRVGGGESKKKLSLCKYEYSNMQMQRPNYERMRSFLDAESK